MVTNVQFTNSVLQMCISQCYGIIEFFNNNNKNGIINENISSIFNKIMIFMQ